MHEPGIKNDQNLQTEIIQSDSVWRFFLKVQIAARNLADDLQKILQAKAVLKEETGAELFM